LCNDLLKLSMVFGLFWKAFKFIWPKSICYANWAEPRLNSSCPLYTVPMPNDAVHPLWNIFPQICINAKPTQTIHTKGQFTSKSLQAPPNSLVPTPFFSRRGASPFLLYVCNHIFSFCPHFVRINNSRVKGFFARQSASAYRNFPTFQNAKNLNIFFCKLTRNKNFRS
jgi:hypothetical protein